MARAESESSRAIPIHQSFLQPLLIFGVEREMLFVTAMTSGMLIFSLGNAYLAIIGVVMWLATLPLLQAMAKADPQMSRVYVRHARYARYFPALAHYTAATRGRAE